MGLQFVFGGSGAGKSTTVYEKVIAQSMRHPEKNYLIMVPDQFTMSTQKQLCMMHPRGGIMNVDVLSFSRMIYRIAEEVGRKERVVLDDTGKNLVLRRVAMEKQQHLVLLKEKVKRPGYIHEVKSMISEFYQYDIGPDDLDEMIAQAQGKGALTYKMQDLKVLYEGFAAYIRDKFITTEESLDELCKMVPRSKILKDSVIVFDGFTGFTPVQIRVLAELFKVAEEVIVTLCCDNERDIFMERGEQHLFALTKKTYQSLVKTAKKCEVSVREPIYLSGKPVKRYAKNPPMAFLEQNLFRYHREAYEGQQQAISIWEADNLVSEVQRVCLEMKKMVRTDGLCYRDMAVVTGGLDRYANLICTEFARYQIPYFMDQNRSVAHHPLTEYMKGALGILCDRFSYESVFRFLRSGLTTLSTDEIDRLDSYVRACGIRGKKAYTQAFTYLQQAEEMDVIREKMMQEIAPVLVECKTAGEYAEALFNLCHENCLQEKCNAYAEEFAKAGDASKAKEYEKIYPACMDLLNQIHELIGEDEMDEKEFLSLFEAGIAEIRIGTIPQNVDQVVVGDMERTRLKNVRVLFFIGVNDGVIPGNGGAGGLLSDMEREFFLEQGRELAPTPRRKLFEQRLYLYQNMTKPSDRLYLSYSRVDGSGKTALPAYLIRVIQGLYPQLKIQRVETLKEPTTDRIETAEDGLDDLAEALRVYLNKESGEEEAWKEMLKVLNLAYGSHAVAEKIRDASLTTYENIPLSDMAAELLYRDRNKGSVSRLEQFAACAYAHFLRYGLELKEQEEYDFNAMDFGIIYHHVLERLFCELSKQRLTLVEADQEVISELIDQILNRYAEEYGAAILHNSARNMQRIRQMKTVLLCSVKAMQVQLSKGKFVPAYFEKGFQLKGDFPLVGKIDRIDLCREDGKAFVKVVDYKSGNKKFDLQDLYYGLSLQLPAYMNAALEFVKEKQPEEEAVPASMQYLRLHNPYVKDSAADVEHEIRMEMRPHGVSNESDAVIRILDEELTDTSEVVRIKVKKDGSLDAKSQTVSEETFRLILDYTDHKMQTLMEEMQSGQISALPAVVEGDKNDSCSFCAYKGICRIDPRIPGYEVRELKKMSEEIIEEEMRNEVYGQTAGSHIDET